MTTITFDTIGTVMPDGTIYAGISPDTGRPMFTTPKDAPLTMTVGQAAMYAKDLDAHSHRDWRVPTKVELNVLFQNRAAINDPKEGRHSERGWYWSSSRCFSTAWAQRFSDGIQYDNTRDVRSALRCVRG
jgi:hypothetical protein